MKRYRPLLFVAGAIVLALILSTTSLCSNMAEVRELMLFKDDSSAYRITPPAIVQEFAHKDRIPADWSFFTEEQEILAATNGLLGPLKNDFFRAGALRLCLRPIIEAFPRRGDWPTLAVSPDGNSVKFMSIETWTEENAYCTITTLQHNNSRLWPRYRQVDKQEYTIMPPTN